MTAEYNTFDTIGGDTERVLVGIRGPVVYAPKPEREAHTWRQRVEDAALGQPINQMTLHRLRALEGEIRAEAAATHRGETREHVEAIALVCAYKLQIMQVLEAAREEARERAQREGRVRYVP